MPPKFSSEEDDLLTDLVRQYPPLYQIKSRSYKDAIIKNNIWKIIAGKVGKTADECRARWKGIRDYYQRKKRGYIGTGSQKDEDADDNFIKKFGHLRFLDASIEERSVSNINDNNNEDLEDGAPLDTEVWHPTENTRECKTEHELLATNNSEERAQEKTPECNVSGSPRRKRKSRSFDKASLSEEIKKSRVERADPFRELVAENKVTEPTIREDPATEMFFKSIAVTVSQLPRIMKARVKTEIMNIVSRYEVEALTERQDTLQSQ